MFAALLPIVTGCSDMCANEVASRAEAPDGKHSAIMFQRDCGATTGFSTQISLSASGDEPSGGGNTFRADGNHGAAVTGDWGGPWAEMRWTDNDTLLIRYASTSRIFERNEQVAGVKIRYQEVGQ